MMSELSQVDKVVRALKSEEQDVGADVAPEPFEALRLRMATCHFWKCAWRQGSMTCMGQCQAFGYHRSHHATPPLRLARPGAAAPVLQLKTPLWPFNNQATGGSSVPAPTQNPAPTWRRQRKHAVAGTRLFNSYRGLVCMER